MPRSTRRDALKQVASAGLGLVVAPAVLRGQTTPIIVAGQPVEIAVASISPSTVRITIAATNGASTVPDDGALVACIA